MLVIGSPLLPLTAQWASTLIIRALMISVAPSVSPVSAHQCLIPVHINATYQCPSELPFSATYQCTVMRITVLNSAIYECCLSVPISDACPCPSVPPI
ncbi:unnamed protein product, partial [Staurois parvus]